MSEEPFKNREIIEMFSDVKNDLANIIVQTTKTNGSVANLKSWQDKTIGAMAVLMLVVVPMLAWALSILVNLDSRIQTSVNSALANYEVNVTP